MLEKKICPACGGKLTRKAAQYYWRGATMHGWVCEPCFSLWDINSAFIRYVQKRAKYE